MLNREEKGEASLSQLAENPIKVCTQDVRDATVRASIKLEQRRRGKKHSYIPPTLCLLQLFLLHRSPQDDRVLLNDKDLYQLVQILILPDRDEDLTICFAQLRNLFKFERLSALQISCRSLDDFKVICGIDYRYAHCAALLRSARIVESGGVTYLYGMDYCYPNFPGRSIDESKLRRIVMQKKDYPPKVLDWCDDNFKEYMDYILACPVESQSDFFSALGNLLLADICTAENKKFILDHTEYAIPVTYAFYELVQDGIYTPENREAIISNMEDAKTISYALRWLVDRKIYNEENRATVLNDLPAMDYLKHVGKNKLSSEEQDPELNQKLFDETIKRAKQKRLFIWKCVTINDKGEESKEELVNPEDQEIAISMCKK